MAENPDNSTSKNPSAPNTLKIPALESKHTSYSFGRMDSDYSIITHVVEIDGQDTLSGQTYDQLLQLSNVALGITRNNFIRMWKTLILKRVQDVYEKQTHVRGEHFVRLDRGISLPAPLADLLYSLGSYHSNATGHIHQIEPPARPANPQEWWALDAPIVRTWNQTIARLAPLYTMKEYPSQGTWNDKPLMLTRRHAVNNYVSIKSWTNEPTMQDGYIRAVNDELFGNHQFITFNNCALNVVHQIYAPQVIGNYVGSYVIQTNS